MKKTFIMQAMLMFSLIMLIASVSANGNAGSIWTTRISCDTPQDANQYAIGEDVYVHGSNFDSAVYDWNIIGLPENQNTNVASGSYDVTSNAEFCFYAYTIQPNDSGEYKIHFGNKQDNYRINENLPVVPEFGYFAGLLTIISAVAVFFVVRRN